MGPSPVNFTQPASQQLRDQWRDFRFVMKTFLEAGATLVLLISAAGFYEFRSVYVCQPTRYPKAYAIKRTCVCSTVKGRRRRGVKEALGLGAWAPVFLRGPCKILQLSWRVASLTPH